MSTPSYKRLGSTPAAMSSVLTSNIYNPTSGIFAIVRALHVANKTAGAVNFTLYLGTSGATTAGTELWFQQSVPADSVYDWFGLMQMGSSDFLVGGASAGTSLTVTIMGEEYVVPPVA